MGKKKAKYSEHASYYHNNKEVPSATTVLKLLNKPALMEWANYLGFKRQRVKDVLNDKAFIGTTVHNFLESYIQGHAFVYTPTQDIDDNIILAHMMGFKKWREQQEEFKYEFLEKQFSCDSYGGTVDFYGTINGKKTIGDFKTSKNFYMGMFLQLAAYTKLLELHGYKVEQVAIIKVNAFNTSVRYMQRDKLDSLILLFEKLVDVFHINYDIEREWSDNIE